MPSPTLGEYLDQWLETVVRPTLRPTTYRQYESLARTWIIPAVGHVPLAELGPAHLQRLVATLYASSLSPGGAYQVVVVLRACLNRAVKWGDLSASPLRQVVIPRTEHRCPRPLTITETGRFLAAARGERLEAAMVIAVVVGLRRGELAGLQWGDVDWPAGRLSVARQMARGRDGRPDYAPLKTAASRRVVNLPAIAIEALRVHRGAQETEQLRLGTRTVTHPELVFAGRQGGPMPESELTRAYHRVLRRAGIERRRFHDLRHTAATLLMEAGVNPRVVQATLGHAKIEQTLAIYTHVSVDAQAVAAAAMDQLLG